MSTPQLEDGHVRIANELLEAVLAFGFSQRELLVLFTIIRKTYGFNKKEDDMSASQIGDMCKLARTHVTAVLNQLAVRNVITKRPGRFGSIVGIQKDHRKWISAEQTASSSASTESVQGSTDSVHVPNQYATSTESVQVDSTDSVHTKDNLPKDNQQKTVASAADALDVAGDAGEPSPSKTTKAKAASHAQHAIEVLDYLNAQAERNYRPVKANTVLIAGRLHEGATVDECKAVIDLKVREWGNDVKMREYLRPKTLFSATNFANYVGDLGPATGKPAAKGWI